MPDPVNTELLLRETEILEDLARRAQDDGGATEEVSRELRDRYCRWYEEVLLDLPDELGKRFREQYEGNLAKPRIKQYVREPQKKWLLYNKVPAPLRAHGPWQYPFESCFLDPFQEQKHILTVASRHTQPRDRMTDTLSLLTEISYRLPMAISILHRPIHGRAGLSVDDEYDLQRILHALLTLHFEDVRPEETTPSKAGGSYRIDFLLRREKIAVEAKMMRRSLTPRKVGDQLVRDIFGYDRHEGVEGLFAVIYDPERRIDNPRGFESDLSKRDSSFPVHVVVAQG
ncbi:hypothetical protein ACFXBB_07950 [Streptomyces scopuliridis]|uniref:PD-(D/E)XK nuclease domain-containing protein n=1 Tax=Streptomyces scopuliridis TaxID=452529 RepID=UPI0036B05779